MTVYGIGTGFVIIVTGDISTMPRYSGNETLDFPDVSHLKREAARYWDQPWLIEARATPRRTKRGLPAYKPAPQRATRRPCY